MAERTIAYIVWHVACAIHQHITTCSAMEMPTCVDIMQAERVVREWKVADRG